MHAFFLYLAEASVSLAAFALAYRFFLCRLTHFQWNRGYLLGSLLLSLLLPLLPLSSLLSGNPWGQAHISDLFVLNIGALDPSAGSGTLSFPTEAQETAEGFSFQALAYLLLEVYLLGCLYKSWQFSQSLKAVYVLINEGKKVNEGSYCIVHTRKSLPAFSFLHYIFLHANSSNLSDEELDQVLQHEKIHADQKHTLDLLLFELAGVLLWFNPAIYYLGAQVREVHEYQVDATVSRSGGSIRKYGELLLKLASQPAADRSVLNTFSTRQIFHRIQMLTQTKSSPMQKLRFLALLPIAALTLALSSFLGNDTPALAEKPENSKVVTQVKEMPIRKISWTGNKTYTDAQLNKALGLRPGDKYSKGEVNNRLNYTPAETDISSLYMDKGYMFFSITPKETFTDNAVDLEFVIEEGPQVKIGEVRISGNTKRSTAEILNKIDIKAGELFSRSKIIAAQRAIQQMGYFDNEKIGINPIPNVAAGTTDLEFVVVEK